MGTDPWAPGKPSTSSEKAAESARIAQLTQQFVARGGRISEYPPGHSGYVPKINNRIKRVEQ